MENVPAFWTMASPWLSEPPLADESLAAHCLNLLSYGTLYRPDAGFVTPDFWLSSFLKLVMLSVVFARVLASRAR